MSDLHEVYALSEELAEVISAINKGRRFTWTDRLHVSGETKVQHLIFEMHDVLGCCEMVGVVYSEKSHGSVTSINSSTVDRVLSNLVGILANTISGVESYIVGSSDHSAFIAELKFNINTIMLMYNVAITVLGGDPSINRVLIDNKIAKVKKLKHLVS